MFHHQATAFQLQALGSVSLGIRIHWSSDVTYRVMLHVLADKADKLRGLRIQHEGIVADRSAEVVEELASLLSDLHESFQHTN
jgi:hypothetical protein